MAQRRTKAKAPAKPRDIYIEEGSDDNPYLQRMLNELLENPEARNAIIARQFSVIGFCHFFELMHGSPLHSEGKKWIAKAFEAHKIGKGLAQECHRESGKTTVFSKFFAAWLVGQKPEGTGAIVRINDDKANETSAAIADIIANNPRWKMVFSDVVPDPDRGWGAKGYYVKREGDPEWDTKKAQNPPDPSFVGYGWKSGSIIGSRWSNFCIVDDIHDGENTSSEKMLQAVKEFYKDVLKFCIMKDAWEIWNFTPWTLNDVYAHIKSTGNYLINRTPVMKAAKEGDPGASYWEPEEDIPYSGKWWRLYWPDMWGFDRLASIFRDVLQVAFARMMLLDLELLKGVNLKGEWLHEYPSKEISVSWPVFFGVDYASTQDKIKDRDRDNFVLAIMRAIPGGGLVLVDGYANKISKGEALDVVMDYWGIYPTLQRIGVENIGKGEEFYNDLMLTRDMMGKIPPLFPVTHGRKSKGERFENWLAPRFKASRIWISNAPTQFLNDFRNEWLLWPKALHDDRLDGVYMAAVAGEGFMPSQAERTFVTDRKRAENPLYAAFGRT